MGESAVISGDPGLVLLVGAVVVLVAVVASRITHQVGLPSLLVFLGLGLALGEAGLGIRFDDAQLAQALGTSALVLILAEGGLTTKWSHARAAAPAALLLATIGVAISIGVVAVLSHWLLSFSWRNALLLSAVLAPTDAAAVFSVLRKLPLPPRLSGMLEAESGLNDAPAVLAVTLLSGTVLSAPGPEMVVGTVVFELAVGALIGLAVGLLGACLAPPARAACVRPVPDRRLGLDRRRIRGRGARTFERLPRCLCGRPGPWQRAAAAPAGHQGVR
jgi:potassium/hydrogen antiporter